MTAKQVSIDDMAAVLDELGNSREAAKIIENFFARCFELGANRIDAAAMMTELFAKLHASSLNMLMDGMSENVRTSFISTSLNSYAVLMRTNMDQLAARMERARQTEKTNVRFYQ